MRKHQRLRIRLIQINREPIIMVPPIAKISPKLPVHIGHLLLDLNRLPRAQDLQSGLGYRRFSILLPSSRRQPAVLLVHDGLVQLAPTRSVVPDPLAGPVDRLAPPVGVAVEGVEVDVGVRKLGVKVAAVVAVVEAVGVALNVEGAFAARRDEVVGVERLDERRHLGHPRGDGLGRAAGGRAGQVAGAVGAAAGLVGELPGEDSGGVLVAVDDFGNVGLVGVLDLGLSVELGNVRGVRCALEEFDIHRRGTVHRG